MIRRSILVTIGLPVVLLSACGCGHGTRVQLVPRALDGYEQAMTLTTETARWAEDAERLRVLAEFPLPGASRGKPMYLLYLRIPAGVEQSPVGPEGYLMTRGFLIQTRVAHAGLASAVEGEVRIKGSGTGRHAERRLEVTIAFDEGTRLVGNVIATHSAWYVQGFETQRRPADVHSLVEQEATQERVVDTAAGQVSEQD